MKRGPLVILTLVWMTSPQLATGQENPQFPNTSRLKERDRLWESAQKHRGETGLRVKETLEAIKGAQRGT